MFIGINVGDVVVGYPRQLWESLSLNFATWHVLIANENKKRIVVVCWCCHHLSLGCNSQVHKVICLWCKSYIFFKFKERHGVYRMHETTYKL
jgi:hypothetical protein